MPNITRHPVSFLPRIKPSAVKPDLFVPPCHYTVFRHPLVDPDHMGYSHGAVNSGIVAVHNGVVAMTDDMNIETLFGKLQKEDHWFIRKNPGRYTVASFIFNMSFTFLVMQDGSYRKGWTDLGIFLQGERDRGVNTL